MEETLKVLRELLVADIIGDIIHENGVCSVRLREKGVDAKLKRVDLLGIPENSVDSQTV